jgi:hypothetical protein
VVLNSGWGHVTVFFLLLNYDVCNFEGGTGTEDELSENEGLKKD